MAVRVKVVMQNPHQTISHILDDDVGRFTAETWANIFKKYVPMETGMLSDTYITEPWKITYTQPYSHYQWQGVSSKGTPLNYSKEQHRLARSHWEEDAFKNNKKRVANAITEYIRSK